MKSKFNFSTIQKTAIITISLLLVVFMTSSSTANGLPIRPSDLSRGPYVDSVIYRVIANQDQRMRPSAIILSAPGMVKCSIAKLTRGHASAEFCPGFSFPERADYQAEAVGCGGELGAEAVVFITELAGAGFFWR